MKKDKSAYKYKIDKGLLQEFFMSDKPPTEEQIKEIKKVICVVVIKHFASYTSYLEDLVSFALLAVLQRRNNYDPSFSAYNYIYSISRNEIGNNIVKLTKETYVEDVLSLRERLIETQGAELPQEIERYKTYLTGEKDFNYIRLPKKDVLNLLLFLRMHESRRTTYVPSFVTESKNSIQVLYRLLKENFDL